MSEALRLIEAVKVISVRAGDVLILKTPHILSQQTYKDMIKGLEDYVLKHLGLESSVKIMVLDQGLDLEIIRRDDESTGSIK